MIMNPDLVLELYDVIIDRLSSLHEVSRPARYLRDVSDTVKALVSNPPDLPGSGDLAVAHESWLSDMVSSDHKFDADHFIAVVFLARKLVVNYIYRAAAMCAR
jgi:hypothetical protein